MVQIISNQIQIKTSENLIFQCTTQKTEKIVCTEKNQTTTVHKSANILEFCCN